MREWKLKTKYKHRPLERGIPLSQCDVEDILVALEARNEQWSISTTGWNKLVMNDAVDASLRSPYSVFFVSFVFLFFP